MFVHLSGLSPRAAVWTPGRQLQLAHATRLLVLDRTTVESGIPFAPNAQALQITRLWWRQQRKAGRKEISSKVFAEAKAERSLLLCSSLFRS